MVMTLPSENSVLEFKINVGPKITVENLARVQESSRQYISPAFSPDNSFYATFAFSSLAENPRAAIEVRSIAQPTLVASFAIDTLDFDTVRLNEWGLRDIADTAVKHNGHDDTDTLNSNHR